jgi:hypothetical protein
MPLDIRQTKTATGMTSLIIGPGCEAHEFAERAQHVADRFQMVVDKKIAGLDELMWIAHIGKDTFCISWDIWFPEVAVMAWENTPDAAVQKLTTGA